MKNVTVYTTTMIGEMLPKNVINGLLAVAKAVEANKKAMAEEAKKATTAEEAKKAYTLAKANLANAKEKAEATGTRAAKRALARARMYMRAAARHMAEAAKEEAKKARKAKAELAKASRLAAAKNNYYSEIIAALKKAAKEEEEPKANPSEYKKSAPTPIGVIRLEDRDPDDDTRNKNIVRYHVDNKNSKLARLSDCALSRAIKSLCPGLNITDNVYQLCYKVDVVYRREGCDVHDLLSRAFNYGLKVMEPIEWSEEGYPINYNEKTLYIWAASKSTQKKGVAFAVTLPVWTALANHFLTDILGQKVELGKTAYTDAMKVLQSRIGKVKPAAFIARLGLPTAGSIPLQHVLGREIDMTKVAVMNDLYGIFHGAYNKVTVNPEWGQGEDGQEGTNPTTLQKVLGSELKPQILNDGIMVLNAAAFRAAIAHAVQLRFNVDIKGMAALVPLKESLEEIMASYEKATGIKLELPVTIRDMLGREFRLTEEGPENLPLLEGIMPESVYKTLGIRMDLLSKGDEAMKAQLANALLPEEGEWVALDWAGKSKNHHVRTGAQMMAPAFMTREDAQKFVKPTKERLYNYLTAETLHKAFAPGSVKAAMTAMMPRSILGIRDLVEQTGTEYQNLFNEGAHARFKTKGVGAFLMPDHLPLLAEYIFGVPAMDYANNARTTHLEYSEIWCPEVAPKIKKQGSDYTLQKRIVAVVRHPNLGPAAGIMQALPAVGKTYFYPQEGVCVVPCGSDVIISFAGDFDGDHVNVFTDPIIINAINMAKKAWGYLPLYFEPQKGAKADYTGANVAAALLGVVEGDAVGMASNMVTMVAAQLANMTYGPVMEGKRPSEFNKARWELLLATGAYGVMIANASVDATTAGQISAWPLEAANKQIFGGKKWEVKLPKAYFAKKRYIKAFTSQKLNALREAAKKHEKADFSALNRLGNVLASPEYLAETYSAVEPVSSKSACDTLFDAVYAGNTTRSSVTITPFMKESFVKNFVVGAKAITGDITVPAVYPHFNKEVEAIRPEEWALMLDNKFVQLIQKIVAENPTFKYNGTSIVGFIQTSKAGGPLCEAISDASKRRKEIIEADEDAEGDLGFREDEALVNAEIRRNAALGAAKLLLEEGPTHKEGDEEKKGPISKLHDLVRRWAIYEYNMSVEKEVTDDDFFAALREYITTGNEGTMASVMDHIAANAAIYTMVCLGHSNVMQGDFARYVVDIYGAEIVNNMATNMMAAMGREDELFDLVANSKADDKDEVELPIETYVQIGKAYAAFVEAQKKAAETNEPAEVRTFRIVLPEEPNEEEEGALVDDTIDLAEVPEDLPVEYNYIPDEDEEGRFAGIEEAEEAASNEAHEVTTTKEEPKAESKPAALTIDDIIDGLSAEKLAKFMALTEERQNKLLACAASVAQLSLFLR